MNAETLGAILRELKRHGWTILPPTDAQEIVSGVSGSAPQTRAKPTTPTKEQET